ncbi:MAG TPA: efflux RND transporter periplasmic adaptor subunit [Acidobacteriota bacterium]|nr:efflux RND transporter periplasmic adaptor subunit [Acidobacteriota bacterium]
MKKLIFLLVAVVALVWAAGIIYYLTADRGEGVRVESEVVERSEELVAKVTATGEIRPKEYVELQSEITGIITALYVREGDRVAKGDLLLKINPKQLELATVAEQASYEIAEADSENQQAQVRVQESMVERDEAGVRKAEAEAERARQAYDIAQRAFQRKQQMHEDRLISREIYDQAKNELVNAETALTSAELSLGQAKAQLNVSKLALEQERVRYQNALKRVRQSKANLERQQDEFSKTTIRSPLSGVITQMNVEIGERAVPGTLNNPAATLMVIADLSVIEAEVEVDETDIVNVELGQTAEVLVDALPDAPLEGRVTEVGSSAIQSGGQEAKDFRVIVQLTDPPASLRPGLSCTAEITTAVRRDVLTIPIQALTLREIENKDEASGSDGDADISLAGSTSASKSNKSEKKKIDREGVFRIEENKAVFVPVATGITGEIRIEVLSGLQEGDRIVTGSYRALRNLESGDPVRIEDDDESEE